MTYENFRFEIDKDGIALIIWDMPERSMNVITFGVMDELDAIIDAVSGDETIRGAVITSGKDAFSGGADLTMLATMFETMEKEKASNPEGAAQKLLDQSRRLSQIFRKLETCGKPFVSAINGTCMGGAFELSLACHARVAAEGSYKMGLPEVKVGLFPGAGGTQRVIRMTDTQAGLTMLLQGQELRPDKAKAMGLIDAVVAQDDLIAEAKKKITDGLSAVKPWDEKGYKLQGAAKVYSPAGFQFWPAANAIYRRETHDNYPGASGIMHSVYEGLTVPFDTALTVESRHFAHVLQTKECAAMIRSLFVSMQALGKGARRPDNVPASDLKTVAVIGAGFMGAGIAFVSARAGLNVILIDQQQHAADKGKAHSEELCNKQISRKRMTEDKKNGLLERIVATTDYAALKEADLVVEAVFEDRGVKDTVIKAAQAHMRDGAIFASNTSTLPITSLAKSAKDATDFIGIHFFSPVDKMMLVEVIMGENTGDKALATALDFVRAIKKTPIVVNDSRGFYVNRCVMRYMLEAHLMLMDGVPAAMVENIAKQAGMPVGPLALNDEVAVDLAWKILQATKKDMGEQAIDPRQEKLLEAMVVKHERLGRKNARGFYDYDGKNKKLWPGLKDIVEPKSADSFDRHELRDRLLVTQALEAARTVEEGVVTDPREADVGSILGYGFAPYTGGTLSYIDGMGAKAFVALAKSLQDKHGDRFTPPQILLEMAEKNETFYERFGMGNGMSKSAA
jgi:3-hydroxyacyl-CoA dehydrogenase/enoyl-CoA hydratase/3-hydroxybutyryl-CoA epimerase